MGTKMLCESYLPVYRTMRDLNKDCSWSLFYGDMTVTNRKCYNRFVQGTNRYLGFDKDVLKQKILEHEAIFNNQVYELHRLYGIQREMMEEIRRKEQRQCILWESTEPVSSSSLQGSHAQSQPGWFPFPNESVLQESETRNSRPLKMRKKLIDLELLGDEYVDTEEGEKSLETKVSNVSTSASRLRNSTGLGDPNNPVEIEEAIAPLSLDLNQPANSDAGHELLECSGLSKSNISCLRLDKLPEPSHPARPSGTQPDHPCGMYSSYGSADLPRNGNQDFSCINNCHIEPPVASLKTGSYPFFGSCLNGSWAHAISSWEKPNGGLISRRFGTSPNGLCCADSNQGLEINLKEVALKGSLNEVGIVQNLAFVDEKTMPEDRFSPLPWLNRKRSRADVAVDSRKFELVGDSSYTATSSSKFCCMSEVVADLNQPFTPKDKLTSRDCEIVRMKERVGTQSVEKLLGFTIFETDAVKKETLAHVPPSTGSHAVPERKIGLIDINLKYEPDEAIVEELNNKQKNGKFVREYIDLNCCVSDVEDDLAPCDESKFSSIKATRDIDLEAPVLLGYDDDDDNATLHEIMVDLPLQSLEDKNDELQDEVLRNAAEALVTISTSRSQMDKPDSLLWFVDALSSHASELESNKLPVRVNSSKDFSKMDEFEVVTLQLLEMQESEHIPEPFVPDTGMIVLATMSRRVQSRRGRQRRDFQRDILPGLISLSRHEVTDDLQVFAGLMRATGHHWNSGLTRRMGTRSGGSRGRRRAVVETASLNPAQSATLCIPLVEQLNGIEGCLVERKLTAAWGKTPRRPRRQRCHAGNLQRAVVLT